MLSQLSTLNSRLSTRLARAVVAAVIIGDAAWLLRDLPSRWDDWRAAGRQGFVSRRHTDGSRYIVFTPHAPLTTERLPLIVFLNGTGENGDDGVMQISNNFGSAIWELKGRFPFAALATQCGGNGSWAPDSADTRRLLEVLDGVIADYGIDPDRVYLTGPSAGGSGTWRLAAAFPERFAAIVPMASGSCDMPEDEAIARYTASNLPIWNFCNSRDLPALVEFNRRMHERLVAAGLDSRLTTYDADGHDCWTDAYRTPALYEWLWNQSRAANSQRAKYRPLVDREPLRDVEIRFEFQFDAPEPCRIILRDMESDASHACEIHGVIAWPQQGTGGFLRVDRQAWLASADPVAQRSLTLRQWNDIQLTIAQGRLALTLNGLPLCATDVPEQESRSLRFDVAASEPGRVRHLRVRPLAAGGDE